MICRSRLPLAVIVTLLLGVPSVSSANTVMVDFNVDSTQFLLGNPYFENGFRFEEIAPEGTAHVYDGDGFLALGDWWPGKESSVFVDYVGGAPFTLLSLEAYVTTSPWDETVTSAIGFASSKGGVRLAGLGFSVLDFSGDPLWEDITWFRMDGIPDGDESLNEGSVDNMVFEVPLPEPSSLALLLTAVPAMGVFCLRRKRASKTR